METKTETNATVLLVNGAAGIYCWKELAEGYSLFTSKGDPISAENLAGLKGDDWCELLEDIQEDLHVKNDDGVLWSLYQDGDIWAINPLAEWYEARECYLLPHVECKRIEQAQDLTETPQVDFEGGEFYLTCLASGAQWSIHDASPMGYSFEQVSQGEEN